MDPPRKPTFRLPLPRTSSKVLFSLIMAGYSLIGALVLSSLLSERESRSVFDGPFFPIEDNLGAILFFLWVVVVTPILETLLLVGIATGVQRVTQRRALAIVLPVALLCVLHGIPRCFIVAPLFLACMFTYLRWRERSFGSAFVTTTLVHCWANLVPAVLLLLAVVGSYVSGTVSTLIDGRQVAYAFCEDQVLFVLVAGIDDPKKFTVAPAPHPCEAALSLNAPGMELSIAFDGQQTLTIGERSFEVSAGRVFCILGEPDRPRIVQLHLPEVEAITLGRNLQFDELIEPIVRHPSVASALQEEG
jgi:hypothetical protein